MGRQSDGRDDAPIWRALKAIRAPESLIERREFEKGQLKMRQRLLMAQALESQAIPTWKKPLHHIVRRLTGNSASASACVEWLKTTNQFSKRDLQIISRVRLFLDQGDGLVSLRPQRISNWQAALWLAGLCFIGGVWAGWVIGTHQTQPEQMIFGIWFGTLLGIVAGYVLENSFRFARVKERVLAVAPWFS